MEVCAPLRVRTSLALEGVESVNSENDVCINVLRDCKLAS